MGAGLIGLLLTGCGGLGLDQRAGLEDSGAVLDSAEPLPDLRIESLSPDWGPTAGSTAVTITGAGFDASAQVFFGGSEVTATWLNESTLTVSSPAALVEASVDVTVIGELGETVLADGFTYSDSGDPDPDTGESGTGSSGLTGGLVELWYQAYFCAECFGLSSQLQISATATFHDPTAGSWLDWIPARGSCSSNVNQVQLVSTGTDVGEWVYLATGGTSLSLRRTSTGALTTYTVNNLAQSDYIKNAAYDLTATGLSLDGVIQTTSGFDSFDPIDIAQTSIQQAFSARISASSARLGWAPSGTDADMTLLVEIFSQTGQFQGSVICRDSDTGSLTVPSNLLSGYAANSLLALSFYRTQIVETINPDDGSTIEGLVMYGGIGTGTLVP